MELKINKNQHGYLLIVAIIAIVIIGVIAATVVNMYTVTVRSISDSSQSQAAFYIAKAGLEITRRDLLKTGATLTCSAITGASKYTAACYPPGSANCSGYFTVTGDEKNITTTLSDAISSTTTTINVSNATNLTSSGIVVIDSEAIWYSGINGIQLQNVMRGSFNTSASSHISGSKVIQNTCALTATASIPTITNPDSQQTIQELLWKSGTGSGGINGMVPALIAAGSISLTGNSSINNSTVSSLTDPKIKGSTIASGGPVVLNGNANTTIGNGTVVSSANKIGADINQNDSSINLSTLWGYIFTQSKTSVKNSSTTTIVGNCCNYDFANATGTIWVTCNNFNPSGNTTIGTLANPVVLIIDNNANISGNLTVNGLMYVTGCLSVTGNASANGMVAVEGAINLNGNGSINYNYQAISGANIGFTSSAYSNYYVSQELFN